MDITARHREAESRFFAIVQDAGVAPPDAVEYAADELTFYWYEPRLAVIVELDDSGRRPAPSSADLPRGEGNNSALQPTVDDRRPSEESNVRPAH